jgi:hypothetical protein
MKKNNIIGLVLIASLATIGLQGIVPCKFQFDQMSFDHRKSKVCPIMIGDTLVGAWEGTEEHLGGEDYICTFKKDGQPEQTCSFFAMDIKD